MDNRNSNNRWNQQSPGQQPKSDRDYNYNDRDQSKMRWESDQDTNWSAQDDSNRDWQDNDHDDLAMNRNWNSNSSDFFRERERSNFDRKNMDRSTADRLNPDRSFYGRPENSRFEPMRSEIIRPNRESFQNDHQNNWNLRERYNYWSGVDRDEVSRSGNHQDKHSFTDSIKDTVKSFFGKGPKGYQRSDDRIKEDVSELLYRHPRIDASEIEVAVKDATVTLTGSVEDRQMKRLIEDVVEDCSGVKNVVNQIMVNSSAGMRGYSMTTTSNQQNPAVSTSKSKTVQ